MRINKKLVTYIASRFVQSLAWPILYFSYLIKYIFIRNKAEASSRHRSKIDHVYLFLILAVSIVAGVYIPAVSLKSPLIWCVYIGATLVSTVIYLIADSLSYTISFLNIFGTTFKSSLLSEPKHAFTILVFCLAFVPTWLLKSMLIATWQIIMY